MTRLRLLLAALALVATAHADAHAGGFFTARFGAEDGHAATDHPSAVYYNPAGLALGHGTRLVLEGGLGYRAARYTRPDGAIDNILAPGDVGAGTPEEAVGANAGRADLTNMVAVPFFAVASDLGVPNLGVALSLSVPLGGAGKWDQNKDFEGDPDYPGAVDGVQRWQVIEGQIQSIYLTAAGAYYIPSAKLSVGLGVNFVMSKVDVIRARNASSTDDLGTTDGLLLEGRSRIEASSNDLSLGLGVMWLPTDQLRIGLSYQSQPGFGTNRLEGDLTNKFGAADTTVSPIIFEQTLPDVTRLAANYRFDDKLEVHMQVDYQRWSVFDKQCVLDAEMASVCDILPDGNVGPDGVGIIANIPRDFHDSFGIRVGGGYQLTSKIELQAGLSYDANAVPDATLDASFVDMPKVVGVAGGRFVLGGDVSVSASWTQVYYVDRTTEPGPRKMGPSRVPSSAGHYQQDVGLFQLAVEYGF